MDWYAVATFGKPTTRLISFYRDLDQAIAAAKKAKGTGTCTTARVIRCPSRRRAQAANLSKLQPGERVVYTT